MFRLALASLLISFGVVSAQDRKAEIAKQKTQATDNLKQIKIAKPTLVETDDLLVYGELTEEKLKPIADAAQKAFAKAWKDLKFEENDRKLPGKLTLYVLADRSKEYTPFAKLIEQRSGKLDADEMQTVIIKGTEPHAAITVPNGSKSPEAGLKDEAILAAAAAVLEHKAGATAAMPTWFQKAFSKAIAHRLDAKAGATHAAKVKPLFAKNKVNAIKIKDVWGDTKFKEQETLMVSLVEYIAYGVEAPIFNKFMGGFSPSEERREPSFNTALEAAEWTPESLELAWKTWVMKQK